MSASNFSLKSSAKLVWLKRGLGLSVLLGFAWLVISAVSNDISDEELNPIVVKAPELIKQRPETPGGMKIDHQDKQLFDLLESETSVDSVNKAVIAKAKQVELQNNVLATQAIQKKELSAKLALEKEEARKAEELKAQKAEIAKNVVKVKKVEVKKVETKTAPVAAKVEPKKVEPKVETTKPAAVVTAKSGWAVQLGSFRKDADANRAVGVYTKKVGNVLTGLTSYVKKVDLGAKGTVYRVYFTGLRDKEHAKQICSQLKVQKQACLRAKI